MCRYLFNILNSYHLDKYAEVEWPDPMVVLFRFLGTSVLFFIMAVPTYISNSYKGSLFSISFLKSL